MKTFSITCICIFLSCIFINSKSLTHSRVKRINKTEGYVLRQYAQSGSGLIRSIDVGDEPGEYYAMRIRVNSALSHIRIDWHSETNMYPMTYVPGADHCVDIPTFSTNRFVISAEAAHASSSPDTIYTQYETRGYYVVWQ